MKEGIPSPNPLQFALQIFHHGSYRRVHRSLPWLESKGSIIPYPPQLVRPLPSCRHKSQEGSHHLIRRITLHYARNSISSACPIQSLSNSRTSTTIHITRVFFPHISNQCWRWLLLHHPFRIRCSRCISKLRKRWPHDSSAVYGNTQLIWPPGYLSYLKPRIKHHSHTQTSGIWVLSYP